MNLTFTLLIYTFFSDAGLIKYPTYIAYQSHSTSVSILTFKSANELGELYSFENEEINYKFSNFAFFASTKKNGNNTDILLRPLSTLILPQVKTVVEKVMISSKEDDKVTKRIVTYERKSIPNKSSHEVDKSVKVIRGGDKSKYGWYEMTETQNVKTTNTTMTYQWFDKNSVKVREIKRHYGSMEKSDKNQIVETNSILFDRTEHLRIFDCKPFNINDEMCGYYGFESYETRKIGSSDGENEWKINNAKIISDSFSFTGNNYLEMSMNSYFEGNLTPSYQNITYVASAWVRPRKYCTTKYEINHPTPDFNAIIYLETKENLVAINAEVKNQVGEWFYAEIIIDFNIIMQIYRDYMKNDEATKRFTIKLLLRNPLLDVDNVRFFPIKLIDFEIGIYHHLSHAVIETMQSNGIVMRTIYNHFNSRKIGSIQQDGKLLKLTTRSMVGFMRGAQGLKFFPSKVTFLPKSGFLETFDSYTCKMHWKFENIDAWSRAPRQLWHEGSQVDWVEPVEDIFGDGTAAVRFHYNLDDENAQISLKWFKDVTQYAFLKITREANGQAFLSRDMFDKKTMIPLSGELLIMKEGDKVWVWIDGILPQKFPEIVIPWKYFCIGVQGQVLIQDLIVMNEPQVSVEYYNRLGEINQTLNYVNSESVIVTENLYDELGRKTIVTKPTKVMRGNKNDVLMDYRNDFIANRDSVLKDEKMTGMVHELNSGDKGYPYKRTVYASNPLNHEESVGLPGNEYRVSGDFSVKYNDTFFAENLETLFPQNQGFTKQAEIRRARTIVSIHDRKGHRIARYVQVPSYDNLLSTYEYDNKGNLIKVLPPEYHKQVRTLYEGKPYQTDENVLTDEEKQWQKFTGTHLTYNSDSQLLTKRTPDTGTNTFFYNSNKQLRFLQTSKNGMMVWIFFEYNDNNLILKTGSMNCSPTRNDIELNEYLDKSYVPCPYETFQTFDYSDYHPDPMLRNSLKEIITKIDGTTIRESLTFNHQDNIIGQSIFVEGVLDIYSDVQKTYVNDKISTLIYPAKRDEEVLELTYTYNQLQQLVSIGKKGDLKRFGEFEYNGDGSLATEKFGTHKRNLRYNSPGFLEEISDAFLTESLTFTTGGYGQRGNGDGLIMSSTYFAEWMDNADQRWFQVQNYDFDVGNTTKDCYRALRETDYIGDDLQAKKSFVIDTQIELPLACGGSIEIKMAETLERKTPIKRYGYQFAYGNHQELTVAKYFTGDLVPKPLQSDSFFQEGIVPSQSDSEKIWNVLIDNGYIIHHQQKYGNHSATAFKGRSLFREDELISSLKIEKGLQYIVLIERLIYRAIIDSSSEKFMNIDKFVEIYLKWNGINKVSSSLKINEAKSKGKKLGDYLFNKNYFPIDEKDVLFLSPKLRNLLHLFKPQLSAIVRCLVKHFIHELGESSFDLHSYDIDSNGNHRNFTSGFNHYHIHYQKNSNQMDFIRLGENPEMKISHDIHGNVNKAEHKGIQMIEYHPVSQRMLKVLLKDGRVLRFLYNAQGERILKQVYAQNNKLMREIYYVRDDKARVLLDRVTEIRYGKRVTIVTKYIYGPRGLFCFIRDGSIYNVFLDHIGSVRLVIKDSQVVAAYDYLPYGGLMREFGSHADSVRYRFSGEEWDEETELYNFHARMYDPEIGRFYQPDPKSQYFTPYKYAGNSPISYVDPDGQFSTAVIAGGAGLIGAASTLPDGLESFAHVFAGFTQGFVNGWLLKIGFIASVEVVGLPLTIVYAGVGGFLNLALDASNEKGKYDIISFRALNAFLLGVSAGAGLCSSGICGHTGEIGALEEYATSRFAATRKRFYQYCGFLIGGTVLGGMVERNSNNFRFWQWDFTNSTMGVFNDLSLGTSLPIGLFEIGNKFWRTITNPREFIYNFKRDMTFRHEFREILSNTKHPLHMILKTAVMGYLLGAAQNKAFNPVEWDYHSFATYQQIFLGIALGKQVHILHSLHSVARKRALQQLRAKTSVVSEIKSTNIKTQRQESFRIINDMGEPEQLTKIANRLKNERQPKSIIDEVKGYLQNPSSRKSIPKIIDKTVSENVNNEMFENNVRSQHIRASIEELENRKSTINLKGLYNFIVCQNAARRRRRRYTEIGRTCRIKIVSPKTNPDPVRLLSNHFLNVSMSLSKRSVRDEEKFVFAPSIENPELGLYLDVYNETFKKASDICVSGRFLQMSEPGQSDDLNANLHIKNPHVTNFDYIFMPVTPETLVFVNISDDTTSFMNLYNYQSSPLIAIYVNRRDDSTSEKLLSNGPHFLNEAGEEINELKDVNVLYYKDGNKYLKVQPYDGVIVINQELYFEGDEVKNKLLSINEVSIYKIILQNRYEMDNQEALYNKNNFVIRLSDIIKIPKNYRLLSNIYELPTKSLPLVMHRDSHMNWRFIAQSINVNYFFNKSFEITTDVPVVINMNKVLKRPFPQSKLIRRKRETYDGIMNATKINKYSPNSKETSKEHRTLPPETQNHPLTTLPDYNMTLFQGILQLIDIAIRKFTGEKVQYDSFNTAFNDTETFLNATDIQDELTDTIEKALRKAGLLSNQINTDIKYEFYESLCEILKKHDTVKLNELIDSTVNDIWSKIKGLSGVNAANQFIHHFYDLWNIKKV